jgi:putative DNA primase/helicase
MRATENRRPNPHHRSSANKNNSINILAEFTAAMATAGVMTDDPIMADGQLHRVHVEGQRHGTKNGAYVLHGDSNPAGWWLDFVSGVSGTWAAHGQFRMDEETRRQIEKTRAERQAEQLEKHQAAALRAREIWHHANPCHSHPYLERKGTKAHGLRVADWKKWVGGPSNWKAITIPGALLIPLRDTAGAIWNLQAIFPEGHPALGRDKDFLSGARKSGLFHEIGTPTPTILVCEGYATAATVHEMTGHQTFVAFDAGNLKPVAMMLRKRFSGAAIIIAGDNDRHTPGNPGHSKAREAALAVGGKLLIPPFDDDEVGSDWNDWLTNRRFSGSLKNVNLNISPLGSSEGMEAHHGAR